jgi:hypothetical protein
LPVEPNPARASIATNKTASGINCSDKEEKYLLYEVIGKQGYNHDIIVIISTGAKVAGFVLGVFRLAFYG